MSQPNHEGSFLIGSMGLENAEKEARARWDQSTRREPRDTTNASWCAAVVAYIEGYRDSAASK